MAAADQTHIEVRERLGPDEAAALVELFDAARALDGPVSVDADGWTDLTQDGRPGVVGLVAQAGDGRPVGFALVTPGPSTWNLEVVVAPAARLPEVTVGPDLARAAVDQIARAGGGSLQLWLTQPNRAEERIAAAAGLSDVRSLYQVRRPLPVETAVTSKGEPLATRPFRPGEDETAWLEVNNRAFAWHPEQGGWDLTTVAGREAEPWFDPEGFLLLEIDDRLAGFCWTKVHDEEDPAQGEIYVIAVDPDFAGRGLGRALTLAGLDHLAGQGITVGMLYVDASNVGAVKLYADLGFEVDHVNRAYRGTVEARS